jgi:hypothetical protein
VVWTGNEALVYGGMSGTTVLLDGARYDPLGDVWSPISPTNAVAAVEGAWTGDELFVYNGVAGARYEPISDTWTAIPGGGPSLAPFLTIARGFAMTARSDRVLVFGGTTLAGFNLVTNAWIPLGYPDFFPDFSSTEIDDVVDLGDDLLIWTDRAAQFGPW